MRFIRNLIEFCFGNPDTTSKSFSLNHLTAINECVRVDAIFFESKSVSLLFGISTWRPPSGTKLFPLAGIEPLSSAVIVLLYEMCAIEGFDRTDNQQIDAQFKKIT